MQMDEGLDTGDIILQEKISLPPRISLSELHDTCANIGASLLIKTLDNIDNLQRIKQSERGLIYAPKLTKEEGIINWNDSAYAIDCKVRGMTPWPGVFFTHNNNIIKVLATEYSEERHNYAPGLVLDNHMTVACGNGLLKIIKLQKAGKALVSSEEFLRGYKISAGECL
jgi:methionyl-tRNA formyltransferase